MNLEDVSLLPEVSAPFVPSRPPRKMRSLISVQVSEPPSLSANHFPNFRALMPKVRTPKEIVEVKLFLLSRVNEEFAHFCVTVKNRTEVVFPILPNRHHDDRIAS
ncbi:hypothetical protein TNCV_224171 [Trichonephila clavipes]|nr:hypothetical protein TNCV_224171 [Trichonephila clavipes]